MRYAAGWRVMTTASRIAFIGDIHASDKAPAGRVDNYRESIMEKLWGMKDLCKDVDATILMGDVFHNKRPNHVSHSLVIDLMEVFEDWSRSSLYAIPGNHDMGSDELKSLDRQPLGVLAQAGVLEILTVNNPLQIFNYARILARPYSYEGDTDPVYYIPTEEELEVIEEDPTLKTIVVGHGSVLPTGAERPYPYLDVWDIPTNKVDLYVFGHIHEELGVQKLPCEKPIYYANLGSIGRTARTQANYVRTPKFLIASFSKEEIEFEEVEVPNVKPASEVFGVKEYKEIETPSDEIEKFVEALGAGLRADELSIDELLASLGNVDEEVKQLVKQYLEAA